MATLLKAVQGPNTKLRPLCMPHSPVACAGCMEAPTTLHHTVAYCAYSRQAAPCSTPGSIMPTNTVSAGHSWTALWSAIGQLVVKSLLAVSPHLAATYRATLGHTTSRSPAAACSSPRGNGSDGSCKLASSATVAAAGCRCFEVLGYDVMLDAGLKPWLVEANHSPSFNIDSPLDRAVKEQLLLDTVRLVSTAEVQATNLQHPLLGSAVWFWLHHNCTMCWPGACLAPWIVQQVLVAACAPWLSLIA